MGDPRTITQLAAFSGNIACLGYYPSPVILYVGRAFQQSLIKNSEKR